MNVEKVGTAIIGCGAVSDIYLKNLKEKFTVIRLIGCSDRNKWKRDAKAEKYGIRSMELNEVMEDRDIQLVVNLTSPAGHYEISRLALEHGKHVFSEKMMARSLQEAGELCRIASEKKLRLSVAPDTFLGGSLQTAAYILNHGLIGQPLSAVVSLSKDFRTYGEFLPHLNKVGGSLPYDSGCYYLTALAALFGPAKRICAFAETHDPVRTVQRPDRAQFGETVTAEEENIAVGIITYENGVQASLHFNSEVRSSKDSQLSIYGTEGILRIEDPDRFDSPVFLQTASGEVIRYPFTHGYTDNSRGIGAAETAWAIRGGRPQRAGMEMAYHVLELLCRMTESARTGTVCKVESGFTPPAPLPSGFISAGPMSPCEESALI